MPESRPRAMVVDFILNSKIYSSFLCRFEKTEGRDFPYPDTLQNLISEDVVCFVVLVLKERSLILLNDKRAKVNSAMGQIDTFERKQKKSVGASRRTGDGEVERETGDQLKQEKGTALDNM